MNRIRKAVFPVAGFGTRFLPATKASPKEMLPVVDKPLIQYAVEEAVAAGITDLIFITGRNKRSIEDHFDKAYELEQTLEKAGKQELLAVARSVLPDGVSCIFIRQPEPLGLGHAVLCARPAVGNEPFAVLLADDLLTGQPPALGQMTAIYREQPHSLVAVEPVLPEHTRRYGMISGQPAGPRLRRLDGIIEKPAPEAAPSNLGVAGRYLLTPRIFDFLERRQKGAGGEIQLTDAIAELLKVEPVFAYEFIGRRYDCGSKLGYLEATVEIALAHPELKDDFRRYLKDLKP